MKTAMRFLGILSLALALIAAASERPLRRTTTRHGCRAAGWTVDCGSMSELLSGAARNTRSR